MDRAPWKIQEVPSRESSLLRQLSYRMLADGKKIVAQWQVTGEGPESIFQFRWEEFNTSQATRRPDSDFGLILLDRVAPEALGGTAKRYFTDVSYVYELTAPMQTVVDMNELARTEQISAPVRPVR